MMNWNRNKRVLRPVRKGRCITDSRIVKRGNVLVSISVMHGGDDDELESKQETDDGEEDDSLAVANAFAHMLRDNTTLQSLEYVDYTALFALWHNYSLGSLSENGISDDWVLVFNSGLSENTGLRVLL